MVLLRQLTVVVAMEVVTEEDTATRLEEAASLPGGNSSRDCPVFSARLGTGSVCQIFLMETMTFR